MIYPWDMVIFQSFFYVHQRVNHVFICGWIWFCIKAPEQGPFGEGLFGPEPCARRDATAVRMAQWRRLVRPTFVLVSGRYFSEIYPLVNQHSYRTSPFFMGKSTISMVIFNSYFDITRGYHMWINCVNVMSLRFEVHKVDLKDHVREPWSRLVEMLHFVRMIFWLKIIIQLWKKRSSEWPGQIMFFEQFLKIMTPGSSCFHLTKILGPLGFSWV